MRQDTLIRIALSVGMAFLVPNLTFACDGHEHGGSHHEEEEGLVTISDEALTAAKVEVREAGPATLSMLLKVNGRISPVSSHVAHLGSRFSGILREVKKDVGESVSTGDVLAVIESNQNLQKFEVRALQGGIVTERHATIGESIVEDEALFVVMDLSKLWADFTVFQRDVPVLKPGQKIEITLPDGAQTFESTISFISPVVDETTQSRVVRAVVENPSHALAPGAFVTGEIATARFQVPLAITYDSIQTIEGKPTVFVKEGDGFEKREVSVGRTDGTYCEVLSGLSLGERYASSNSFIFKAELGKSEAEHEH